MSKNEISYILCGSPSKAMKYTVYKDSNFINLKEMRNDMIKLGIPNNIDKIMFITEQESVIDINKTYIILNKLMQKKREIHVFSKNEIVKTYLRNFFSLVQQKSKVLTKDITQPIEEKEPDITSPIIIENNDELIKILKEPDFLKLIEIFQNKSTYFEILLSFLSHGDIIKLINFDEIIIDDFNPYRDAFNKLYHILQNYNIIMDENNIKKLIYHFKGNYNLVFRYLLIKKQILI